MVIKKEDGRFYKNCPNCKEEQSYLRRNYAEESLKLNKLCKKCSNRNPSNNQHIGWYKNVLRKSFAHKYKTGAEMRGIEWDISFDYLADLLIDQDFRCALTGELLDAMELNNNCSLDRIDNSKGYIKGNVQWVLTEVNMMKQHYCQDDFIRICILVSNKVKW
jgi:hypothetical protein